MGLLQGDTASCEYLTSLMKECLVARVICGPALAISHRGHGSAPRAVSALSPAILIRTELPGAERQASS